MESDEETQENDPFSGTNGCVILLDVSPPMWKKINDERPVDVILNACTSLLQKIIINSPKQLIGISLFATKKDDNKGINNVVQFMQLKEPSVSDVKKLKEFVSNPQEICKQWGITEDFNLADALWQASLMFSACHKKMSNQTIVLLSGLSLPDPNMHKVILKRASDIRALGININIANVSDRQIPADSFFVELGKVILNQPNLEWDIPEPTMDADNILNLIWSNNHRKSASAQLKMFLGPDVVLGVGLYQLCKSQSLPKKQLLDRDTNDPVVSSNILSRVPNPREDAEDDDSEEFSDMPTPARPAVPVLRSDVIMKVEYGDRAIKLTSEEHRELYRYAGTPSIKLLGFKPASILKMPEWFLKPSAFLYPNEALVEGSTTLFVALRDRCLASGRIAICLMVSRRFSHARYVALVPQKRVTKGNCQIQPDGFHVVYIPYTDHFKQVPLEQLPEATGEQNKCVESILKKLKFKYSGDMFENPKLQTFYKAIEALALEEPALEETVDSTMPDVDEQRERLGHLQDDFLNLFGPMNNSAVKRSQNADSSRKKVASDDSEQMDLNLLISRIGNKQLDKYTIPLLKLAIKTFLPSARALTGMKKDQLVNLIYEKRNDILDFISKSQ